MNGIRIYILTEHGTGDDFYRLVNVIDGPTTATRAPQVLEVANWGISGDHGPYRKP